MSIGIVLAIIFVILKLTHTIAWSWLWVLSPLMAEVVIDMLWFFVVTKASLSIFHKAEGMIKAADREDDSSTHESAEDLVKRLTGPRSWDDMINDAKKRA